MIEHNNNSTFNIESNFKYWKNKKCREWKNYLLL